MSKISRIRILNLNYNNNTIKIDDETFDLGGQNTLISLRNGGGKSVLVQMIVSLFVNRTFFVMAYSKLRRMSGSRNSRSKQSFFL